MKKKLLNIKNIYIFISLVLTTPSIVYLAKNKTIMNFNEWFTFFLKNPQTSIEAILNMMAFGIVIISLFLLYAIVLKKHKDFFKDKIRMFTFIAIISVIFTIAIPFTTSDIFYYMGTGWIDAKYNKNPYYVSVKEAREKIQNDELLDRTGVWEGQTVVYGPLWAYICKNLSRLSFGNATWGLYVYKLAALFIHMGTAILIYKITNKKLFALMYGLNPFILFEGLTNVHNDLYLVFFIVLAMYFLVKKKNILLTVVALALATAIKYVSILFLPFILIYYFREKKPLKRIGYCIIYGLIFSGIIVALYLIYMQDIKIFLAMLLQQSKMRESLIFIIYMIVKKSNSSFAMNAFDTIKWLFYIFFATIYIITVIKLLFKNKITLNENMRKCEKMVAIFLLTVISNLCPWYVMWLYPCLPWIKGKYIKKVIYLSFAYEFCTLYNFGMHSENYLIGLAYIPTMLIMIFCLSFNRNKKKIGGKAFGKTSSN